MKTLKRFAQSESVWIYDGDTVSWHGMPYTTRMTVIKLDDGRLWIHSPSKITGDLLVDLETLGTPTFLVSPNKIHHLYLSDWREIFPSVTLYAPPGLAEKRQDLAFDASLPADSAEPWTDEIVHLVFEGSPLMQEVVFFHRPSQTLILGDLIENFPQNHFSGFKKVIAKATGILSPNGKTPLDWRVSFLLGKKKARQSLQQMLAFNPENIIIAHGECTEGGGRQALEQSFRWL